MTEIIMVGCNGHMGQTITGIVEKDPDVRIAAGVDLNDSRNIDYPVYKNISDVKEHADAVIDFSHASVLPSVLKFARERNVPLIECTTGLSEDDIRNINEASKKVAVVRSANMSVGINLLLKLVQDAVKKLEPEGFDVEIVEKHHNLKKDAPSGTAIALADSINEAAGGRYEYVYDRSDAHHPRDKKELGISAVRAGTIPGEHEIIFAGTDEVITFKHTAYSKSIFGKGAVTAAKFIKGKGAGLYDMRDVLGV
ncbi:MAG: 4-hydroxy-tetrahydrodipicolinate reductase [Lachnospiraceae bacterium]|nr:4-hydroxy-tetrahydrodipicolinate reductase [Lachnospiraceae bacterium]MEE3461264.1 4-hydroxy-tetrahydrodipicolinate reductase [Lachnospiraceae bacterium]